MLVRPGLGFYDVDQEDIFVDMTNEDYKLEVSDFSWTDQLNAIGQKNREIEEEMKEETKVEDTRQLEES